MSCNPQQHLRGVRYLLVRDGDFVAPPPSLARPGVRVRARVAARACKAPTIQMHKDALDAQGLCKSMHSGYA